MALEMTLDLWACLMASLPLLRLSPEASSMLPVAQVSMSTMHHLFQPLPASCLLMPLWPRLLLSTPGSPLAVRHPQSASLLTAQVSHPSTKRLPSLPRLASLLARLYWCHQPLTTVQLVASGERGQLLPLPPPRLLVRCGPLRPGWGCQLSCCGQSLRKSSWETVAA
jgi:hypothetical protein